MKIAENEANKVEKVCETPAFELFSRDSQSLSGLPMMATLAALFKNWPRPMVAA